MAGDGQQALLKLLADGQCYSGEVLGRALGISRAAVWKQVQKLTTRGVPIERLRGQGYRLAAGGLEALDAVAMRAAMPATSRRLLGEVHVLSNVDSTSSFLQRESLRGIPSGSLCVADSQQAGRGRRGRPWVSPPASGLYCSVLWRYPCGVAALEGLSLVVGLVLLESLASLGVADLALKWPNDVVTASGKLAGVLLEMTGDPAGDCQVIIGVGVNLAVPEQVSAAISQAWTDVGRWSGTDLSRNQLLGVFMGRLLPVLADYDQQRFVTYKARWLVHDACRGRRVVLSAGGDSIEGCALGVDESGALLLETSAGTRAFHGGELSLRLRA